MLTSDNERKAIAVIGNYTPRLCGIATFTSDLVQSIREQSPAATVTVLAMDDKKAGYNYPEEVQLRIDSQQLDDYHAAAEFINSRPFDALCIQHEFGIFGGCAGAHILELIRSVRVPVVITLHTVLAEPNDAYRQVTLELTRLSSRLVVLSRKSVDILRTVYGVPPDKISLIPHGVPDFPLDDPNKRKPQFLAQGKKVLLTFGLLSRNKCIETVIEALPAVVEQEPNLVYIVLGATHPNLVAHEGEAYRNQLKEQVRRLGLENHVVFRDTFVTQSELCDYLLASDIFITPYANRDQVVSGTLSYALGLGVPVVSTPYWYAEEALAEERGCLVPFNDSRAMGDVLIELIQNETKRQRIRRRAYDHARPWIWSSVAKQYLAVFNDVGGKTKHQRLLGQPQGEFSRLPVLSSLSLSHLAKISDETGLVQHARFSNPHLKYGYCTDDNARALIVTAEVMRRGESPELSRRLYEGNLRFLQKAFDMLSGRFRNFMSDDQRWLELLGSQDSHGRALWGLGEAIELLEEGPRTAPAISLFRQALPAVELFFSPRSIAFSILGLHAYLTVVCTDSKAQGVLTLLTERLHQQLDDHARVDWLWWEDILAYDNAKLPHALMKGGSLLGSEKMVQAGLASLEWLVEVQTVNGCFAPVGNRGWFTRDDERSLFDQQPVDAHATVHACYAAYELTGEEIWLDRMWAAFDWFLGRNLLGQPLYDAATGGCRDGLQLDGVNQNQGAESTLAWLMSLALVQRLTTGYSHQDTSPALGASLAEATGKTARV